jgi:hypothetical protein
MRPVVAESWRRCLALGIDPDHALPPVELTDEELEVYRSAHPLATVLPVLRKLLVADAAEAGLIVAVSDAGGRLLWVEGASVMRSRAAGMHFVEGADWSEATAGSNAPGTALTLDRPVQFFTAEHLADPVTAWSCTAAPIHDPFTGALLGALDLTGGDDAAAPHSLTLVRMAVAAVESELRLQHPYRIVAPRDAAPRSKPSDSPVPRTPPGLGRPPVERRFAAMDLGIAQGSGPAPGSHPAANPTDPALLKVLGVDRAELVHHAHTILLSPRHSEMLLVLALHPRGLTTDQFAIALHEADPASVTLRAEVSRLKTLLTNAGLPILDSRPYRLTGSVQTDVNLVRKLLGRGAHRRAWTAYPGPVLPGSMAPAVRALREQVDGEVRSCLIASNDADALWEYLSRPEYEDDVDLWQYLHRALPANSKRRPIAVAAIRRLDAMYGIAPRLGQRQP